MCKAERSFIAIVLFLAFSGFFLLFIVISAGAVDLVYNGVKNVITSTKSPTSNEFAERKKAKLDKARSRLSQIQREFGELCKLAKNYEKASEKERCDFRTFCAMWHIEGLPYLLEDMNRPRP